MSVPFQVNKLQVGLKKIETDTPKGVYFIIVDTHLCGACGAGQATKRNSGIPRTVLNAVQPRNILLEILNAERADVSQRLTSQG